MENTQPGFVQIPTQTLNALKNMLFTDNGGVDLTNLINDLTPNEEQRDLTAIHVALAHKGVRIDIDSAPRYEHHYGNIITRHEYVGHSLILGVVKVRSYDCHVDETGDLVGDSLRYDTFHIDFRCWAEMPTDVATILAKI